MDGTHRLKFVESALQVRRDIGGGYRYFVVTDKMRDGVQIESDMTLTNGDPLPRKDLRDAGAEDRAVWEGIWALCCEDASYYRNLRRPSPFLAAPTEAAQPFGSKAETAIVRRRHPLARAMARTLGLLRGRGDSSC